ncbi:dienelactone hydrolase family protein [Loktanella sp. M215]|uniref:dienelactone hydrolase family protein n=1 Tax=Loktanella sp. M215 TaxID=2675431 RepID=UPI001F392006|nr:dienelactone hydrolase family protein [Loktanella sp. M215]MCF7702419.1 dienelactone hydrolase family protein [Loktanella sp. M215]
MLHEKITVRINDKDCTTHVLTPTGSEGGPAILFYFDAGGIRPVFLDMAQRLANAGYVVLVPDLFYRYGPYGPFVPAEVFAGDAAATLGPLMATTGNAVAAKDTEAVLSYLDTRTDVRGEKIGSVGFCLGGGMAIAAAGTYPNRMAAAASFHGGGLATDAPDSPHLYARTLNAELYIAAATDDAFYPSGMADRFKDALDTAGVTYRHETYQAAHGWMKPDFPSYNEAAAERGWGEMIPFLDRLLKDR